MSTNDSHVLRSTLPRDGGPKSIPGHIKFSTMSRSAYHKARRKRLVDAGLCDVCTAARGDSPSSSRCLRCLKRQRKLQQYSKGYKPWAPGKTGRPPLELRTKEAK